MLLSNLSLISQIQTRLSSLPLAIYGFFVDHDRPYPSFVCPDNINGVDESDNVSKINISANMVFVAIIFYLFGLCLALFIFPLCNIFYCISILYNSGLREL